LGEGGGSLPQLAQVTDQIRALPVGAHNEAALKRKSVIPVSILLATGKYKTVADAEAALRDEPILRTLMQKVLQQ